MPDITDQYHLKHTNDLMIAKYYLESSIKSGQDKNLFTTQSLNTSANQNTSIGSENSHLCIKIKNIQHKIQLEVTGDQARLKSYEDYKFLVELIKLWEQENRALINNKFTEAYQDRFDDCVSRSGDVSRVMDDTN